MGHGSADAPYVSASGESGAQLRLDLVLGRFSDRKSHQHTGGY